MKKNLKKSLKSFAKKQILPKAQKMKVKGGIIEENVVH